MAKKEKRPKRRGPLTISAVRKALPGTCGVIAKMAVRLDVHYQTLYTFINDDDEAGEHEELRKEIAIERDYLLDLSEMTVKDCTTQRLDLGIASTTARWALDRRGSSRGYMQKQEVTLEGGQNPLNVQFPIEKLLGRVSVACKKELMAAMKEIEEEEE